MQGIDHITALENGKQVKGQKIRKVKKPVSDQANGY
jgi:hypothetical protein